MRFREDTRQLLAALFGGLRQFPRFRVQSNHDRLMVETRRIVHPLVLVRCPSHTNYALAMMVGLIGRDTEGHIVVEEIRRVSFPRH